MTRKERYIKALQRAELSRDSKGAEVLKYMSVCGPVMDYTPSIIADYKQYVLKEEKDV